MGGQCRESITEDWLESRSGIALEGVGYSCNREAEWHTEKVC